METFKTTSEHCTPKHRDIKNGKRFILAIIAFTTITILNQYYNLRAVPIAMSKPVMSTFFTPVKGGCCGMSEQGHLNLVKAWEEAWQSWGWDTKVLTEEDARRHPRFEEFEEKISQIDVDEYNHRCFWRWLAMANDDDVMGGWMSDYDAFPLLLTGEVGYELMSMDGFKSWSVHVPTLIHADKRSWERMVDYMIKVISPDLDVEIITDMYVLRYLEKQFTKEELNIKKWEYMTYHGGYIYKRVEGSDKVEVDCDGANVALAAHLSHHDTHKAVEGGLFPKLEGMRDGDVHAGTERRGEAATIMMKDYREKCSLLT
jgi:hypothetical protein